MSRPVARIVGLGQRYGKTVALDGIDLEIPAGRMVGLIGPDGVGKSRLLSLLAGARAVQQGTVGARSAHGGVIRSDCRRLHSGADPALLPGFAGFAPARPIVRTRHAGQTDHRPVRHGPVPRYRSCQTSRCSVRP